MSAQYIIRLDDACSTMDHERWEVVERILDRNAVCPVVAVVPDNRDPNLCRKAFDPTFWEKVRRWAAKGWEIAMHGETHCMRRTTSKSIFPFYDRSEFTGLSLDQQIEKLKRAQAIFDREAVRVRTWIAPAHCFDRVTLEALRQATDICIISDGIATQVYYESGFYWVPQQFSTFKKMPFGLWTICLHPNEMDSRAVTEFEKNVELFSSQIIGFSELNLEQRELGVIDYALNAYFWIKRGELRAAIRRSRV